MTNKTRIAAVLSIAFAVGLPLLMAAQAYNAIRTAPIIKVKIEAYDPRNLLYGHYMTFAYDWNWKGGEPQPKDAPVQVVYDKHSCICVGPGDIDPEVELMAECPKAGEKPSCTHVLRGKYWGSGRFDLGQDRYFIDENVGAPLEKMLRSTLPTWDDNGKEVPGKPLPPEKIMRIGLGVLSNGKAVIEKLYIGDQTLDEYLAEHYDELTAPELEPEEVPPGEPTR